MKAMLASLLVLALVRGCGIRHPIPRAAPVVLTLTRAETGIAAFALGWRPASKNESLDSIFGFSRRLRIP